VLSQQKELPHEQPTSQQQVQDSPVQEPPASADAGIVASSSSSLMESILVFDDGDEDGS
jgi:hypothetical protein